MKRSVISIFIVCGSLLGFTQTATNFNCNDCNSVNHDLFSELNSNKVIVMAWVMPCSACISGGLSAYTAVQSFSASNPGQVLFYMADDYADTPCNTLQGWANTNSMPNSVFFSNTAVSMSGYGAAGMPKVIVLGTSGHTVFYNTNGSANITTSGVQNAITSALSAIAAGINENGTKSLSVNLYPNPAGTSSELSISLTEAAKFKIEIQNQLGQKVSEIYDGELSSGQNILKVNTSDLSNGNYFISISGTEINKKMKLTVIH